MHNKIQNNTESPEIAAETPTNRLNGSRGFRRNVNGSKKQIVVKVGLVAARAVSNALQHRAEPPVFAFGAGAAQASGRWWAGSSRMQWLRMGTTSSAPSPLLCHQYGGGGGASYALGQREATNPIQILVRVGSTPAQPVEVLPTASILHVKQLVCEREGHCVEDLCMRYGLVDLANERNLIDYAISSDATLRALLAVNGGGQRDEGVLKLKQQAEAKGGERVGRSEASPNEDEPNGGIVQNLSPSEILQVVLRITTNEIEGPSGTGGGEMKSRAHRCCRIQSWRVPVWTRRPASLYTRRCRPL